jgi:hypothetical protein
MNQTVESFKYRIFTIRKYIYPFLRVEGEE